MPDWPRHHLLHASSIHIKSSEGSSGKEYEWEMSGADFVRCLESGGWKWDAVRRCEFITTGLHGTITAETEHLSAYDGDKGPWFYVEFDDGFRCWVVASDVRTYIDYGGADPITPNPGTPPPQEDRDQAHVLEHVVDLLEGAQAWLDIVDVNTGEVYSAIGFAARDVDAIRSQLETQ